MDEMDLMDEVDERALTMKGPGEHNNIYRGLTRINADNAKVSMHQRFAPATASSRQ